LAGPNPADISTSAAANSHSVVLKPSSAEVAGARPSGPARGVLAIAMSASTMDQQAPGAAPMSSRIRQRAGAVPVRSATWAIARAMPALNQIW